MNPRHVFWTVFGPESWMAGAVFAAVLVTLIVALVLSARRRRRGRPASQRAQRTRLEITYGALIAAVAVGIVYLSFHTNAEENSVAATPAARVDVTAFQWCWRFSYPGHDVTVTGTCANSHLPTMVVPVGQKVTVRVRSDDVIHSWWVPDLRYKMDAFPDHVNTFTFTVDHAGDWIGRCAEFCGDRHYAMAFHFRAVSPDKYQRWLASGGAASALA